MHHILACQLQFFLQTRCTTEDPNEGMDIKLLQLVLMHFWVFMKQRSQAQIKMNFAKLFSKHLTLGSKQAEMTTRKISLRYSELLQVKTASPWIRGDLHTCPL